MKKEMNKGITKRIVVICSLCLALIVALGAFSFAWIQNYGEVGTATITTGKMLYKITMYRVAGNSVTSTVLFDTGTLTSPGPDAVATEGTEVLTKNIDNTELRVDKNEEVFFIIQKYDESIDFDVAITFDKDGLASESAYQNVGQIKYWFYDDSEQLATYSGTDKIDSYVKGAPIDDNKFDPSLSTVWTKIQKTTLSDKEYASIRFKLDSNATFDQYFEGEKIPFRVKFCIAQKDKLPEQADKVQTHYVTNGAELYNVMQNYGFNDEIIITRNNEVLEVDYTDYGDLVFTRPCKLTLIRSTLKIKGNLSFSYMYDGAFTVDTVSDGHIFVNNNDLGSAGNLRIDLPNGKIELKGANNDNLGKADIYVAGMLSANASKDEGEGIFLQGVRICDDAAKSDLEPIFLNGIAKITTTNRTRVGKISVLTKAENGGIACTKVVIDNSGYIEKIDLSKMTKDDSYRSSPAIDIDNKGTIGSERTEGSPLKNDSNVIILPTWAKKFNEKDTASGEDNTRIKANEGSNKILAITSDREFTVSPEIVNQLKFFFSLGDKGDNDKGYPDDIEYNHRKVFVEAIDGDKTKIRIHYEAPTAIVLKEDSALASANLSTLESYVNYYSNKGDIAPKEQITEATIICYGSKALTAPPLISGSGSSAKYDTSLAYDYNFIKSMTALTRLDLSDAVSEDKKVPNNAFKGMAKLSSVKMSESDTVWGQYIFTGTLVDEITFPQALTKLDNPSNSKGKVTKQEVLDGIRYVYTSITIVDGFYLDPSVTQYLFTPDQYTYDAYKALYSNVYWNSKIFINNGATRYGDFFLRYDPTTTELVPTCEFVAYTGDVQANGAWVEDEYNNCGFDFQRININGKSYTITSFDSYAFFDKLVAEENLDIVITSDVKLIGERAFACGPSMNATIGLESVVIVGNPIINGYAFAYNDTLVSVSAPELTVLYGGQNFSNCNLLKTFYAPKLGEVKGDKDISNCPELDRIDISVVEWNDTNKNFYTSNDGYSYAKFYIHTENAQSVSFYKSALAADYRYIFVDENYAKLYRDKDTYTGVVDMGKNTLNDLIEADSDGNDVENGEKPAYYYVLNESKTEAHLVACLLSEINEIGNDYTTIASFNHINHDYPVTYIGSAAYHFTSIVAHSIKICDRVEALGSYAFDSSKEKKYCITLDLNNVDTAGKYAFYYMDMARVIGDNLEEIGAHTFSYNQNLRVANLPNLSRSRQAGSTENLVGTFVGASNLRIAYIGFSQDIAYDDVMSKTKSYIRFVNYIGDSDKITLPKVNTVINSSLPSTQTSFYHNLVKVDKNFTGIYFSDYYNHEISLMGMNDTIELPGYVYHKQDNGELSLIAVSPDIEEFGHFQIGSNGNNDYLTPGYLYKDDEKYISKNNGTYPEFRVTSFGKYAYGAVRMVGVGTFKLADTIKKLDDSALRGSAYAEGGGTIVALNDVKCLDIGNVTEMGKQVCYNSNFIELNALELRNIGEMAFTGCRSLKKVYLPSFISASGAYTFQYCNALTEVTLGEGTYSLANNMFDSTATVKNEDGTTSKLKLTILNSTDVITAPAYLNQSNQSNIIISIPAAIYSQYEKKYNSSDFGKVPWANFQKFGASVDIGGLTYYWNEITKPIIDTNGIVKNPNDCTAYIDYVEGTLPTSLTLPSTFTANVAIPDTEGNPTDATVSVTYKVISVSASTMKALSGVTSVTLPANMQYLTFTTADVASSVQTLSIAGSNTYFKTEGGVLYTKDGTTLLVYPRGRTAASFTVGSGVSEIAYRAFYGANIETLNIAGNVTIRDQAFESATDINSIDLTSGKNVTFAGRDTFLGANVNLNINANGATVRILTDYSISEKLH